MAKHGKHKMPGGMMMKNSDMRGMHEVAKPKFGIPEFFASLKKGKDKKTSKKRVRGGKK